MLGAGVMLGEQADADPVRFQRSKSTQRSLSHVRQSMTIPLRPSAIWLMYGRDRVEAEVETLESTVVER